MPHLKSIFRYNPAELLNDRFKYKLFLLDIMEETNREPIIILLTKLKNTVEQNNYSSFSIIGTSITYFSFAVKEKIGVLIGELLENTFNELERNIDGVRVPSELITENLSKLLPPIQNLIDAIKADNLQEICLALAEIRYFTTDTQFNFPTKFTDFNQRRRLIK